MSSNYRKLVNVAEMAIGAGFMIRGFSKLMGGESSLQSLGYAAPMPRDRNGRLPQNRGEVIEKAVFKTVHNIDQRVRYIQDAIRRDSTSPYIKEAALKVLSRKCGDVWCIPEKNYKAEISALYWAIKDPKSPIAIRYVRDHATVDQFTSAEKTLKLGGGDCFPKGTLLLREDRQLIPIEQIQPGDRIWGRHSWTAVINVVCKNEMETYGIVLSNGKSARLTPCHKIWIDEPALHRIDVSELHPGQKLIRPITMPAKNGDPYPTWWRTLHGDKPREPGSPHVQQILYDRARVKCWDISTDDHYVYLPKADWVVSNCDDSVILLGSLLRAVGYPVRLRVVQSTANPDFDHIYLAAGMPPQKPTEWIHLDTTVKKAYPGWQVPGADNVALTGQASGLVVKVRDYGV